MHAQVPRNIRAIQFWIWIYFWFLIFEGALRKWAFPSLANYFLLIRDPIVIWIYFLALLLGFFPRTIFMIPIFLLALASLFSGLFANHNSLMVTLFGIRTNFLHLPLIFVMGRIFQMEDVKKIGRWVLLISIPMAVLMLLQFRAPAESVINQGLHGEFQQIGSAMEKIRPPGTFSFISGPIFFYPLAAAFLFYGILQKKTYSLWLLLIATCSLVIAAVVSGSRSLILSVGEVFLMIPIIFLIKPRLVGRFTKLIILATLALMMLASFGFFKEGLEVLGLRFGEYGGGIKEGLIQRFLNGFTDAFDLLKDVPIMGHGIGMGTNVGAVLLSGQKTFLLAEGEWERVILESGFLIGPCYLLLRLGIMAYLWIRSFQNVIQGNILPILLFGACGLNILIGTFGQSTILGFTVFTAGLCLASCRASWPLIPIKVQPKET